MDVITFCSFKGGTAKTSCVMNLGACLSKYHNKKVLLVDFDSQANLSIGLGVGPDSLKTSVPVLQGKEKIQDVIRETAIPGLYLIASNAYLDGIERSPHLGSDPYAHERLRRMLQSLGTSFDFCFVDTPPSLGWLTQSAFFASKNSVICAIPEAYSVLAMRRLREFHDSISNYHPISPLGIVLSFWDERGAVNQDFVEEIHKHFPDKLFCSKVRRDVSVSRSVLQGNPVIEADPQGRASQDYRALTCEFLSRIDH